MQSSSPFRIFGAFRISINNPPVLGIETECTAKICVSSTLYLALFDRVDGIRASAVQDIVLNSVLGVVEPRFFDETTVKEAMVVVFNVLQGLVGQRLGREEFG